MLKDDGSRFTIHGHEPPEHLDDTLRTLANRMTALESAVAKSGASAMWAGVTLVTVLCGFIVALVALLA